MLFSPYLIYYSLSFGFISYHFIALDCIPAVLPKPKNIIASRFRSGSAEDEDLMGPEMNDFR